MSVHFFDVDHTIVRGSTARHFLQMAIRMGLSPRRELFRIPILYMRYRLGILGPSILEEELPVLGGKTREQLEAVADRTFAERTKPKIYREALEFMDELRSRGDYVAIATSSVDIIVRPLAAHINVADVLATSFDFRDGVCDGKFLDLPNFGHEKKERALAFLRERGLDPGTCSFYTDSIYDLPLLKEVGNPVAVNPDVKLTAYAHRNKWRIIRFSH